MSKIQIAEQESFVKILSFHRESVDPKTVIFLLERAEYKDLKMQEDLYSCEVIEEVQDYSIELEIVLQDLEIIKQLCDKHDASYFRFVNL